MKKSILNTVSGLCKRNRKNFFKLFKMPYFYLIYLQTLKKVVKYIGTDGVEPQNI